ncbi:ABC transporter ATP-binding protein [Paenibacillus puerhi]|uniref:ABC transporter ATP-binding protein n=1 Tax=Paenibacillus puerhi TaxID=2692622 RepID=UPI00135AC291|nr:ABC transporter ATP-binding protein [Paenibacillus puerhi]
MMMLELDEAGIVIDGKHILRGISLCADKGQFIGLLGPNGSGKSTLLRTMAGLRHTSSGRILVAGRPLDTYSRKPLARLISYVPQDTRLDFAFRVREVVLMGRHPHVSRFRGIGQRDRLASEQAMDLCGVRPLADRLVTDLSGGQRQMVMIAKALAQEPQLLLLDEPISALDIRHQLRLLALIRKLTASGVTAVAALHDLNLAARFCDRLALLHKGTIIGQGTPEQVLTPASVLAAYGVQSVVRPDPQLGCLSVTAIGETELSYL